MEKILDPFREDQSSYSFAKDTAILLREILKEKLEKNFTGVNDLLNMIINLEKILMGSKPLEFSIANIIKRVTSIIREQAQTFSISIDEAKIRKEDEDLKFIKRMGSFNPLYNVEITKEKKDDNDEKTYIVDPAKLKEFQANVLAAVDDVLDEFDRLTEEINKSASNHINSNEIILTYGDSYTIGSFLLEAAKKKTFEVIVVQNNLNKKGSNLAQKLTEAKIKATVIPDTSVYAIMPRVHKALISAHSIMANGGILGTSGSLIVTMACKAHLVPVIVIGGIYKLTPKISFEQDTYNEVINPGAYFKISDNDRPENVDVIIPLYDYITPDYVTLYITNMGEHTPAYLYRVFGEYYVKE